MLRNFLVASALLIVACGDTADDGSSHSADGDTHPITSGGSDSQTSEIAIAPLPAKTDISDPGTAADCDARAAAPRGTFTAADSLSLGGAIGVKATFDRPNTISFAFDFPVQLWKESSESWAQDSWSALALDVPAAAGSASDPFTVGTVSTIRLWNYGQRKSVCAGTEVQAPKFNPVDPEVPPVTDTAKLTITNRTSDHLEGTIVASDGSPLLMFAAPLVDSLSEIKKPPCCLSPRTNSVAAADPIALVCAARKDFLFHGSYDASYADLNLDVAANLTAAIGDNHELLLHFGDGGSPSFDPDLTTRWSESFITLSIEGQLGRHPDEISPEPLSVTVVHSGISVTSCDSTAPRQTTPPDPAKSYSLGTGELFIAKLLPSSIEGSLQFDSGAFLEFKAPFEKALPAFDPAICCTDPVPSNPPPSTTPPPTEDERLAFCAARDARPHAGTFTADPALGLDASSDVSAKTGIESWLADDGSYHFDRRFVLDFAFGHKENDPTYGPSYAYGDDILTLIRTTTRTPSLPFAVGRYENVTAEETGYSMTCYKDGGEGNGGDGSSSGTYALVITSISDTEVEGTVEIQDPPPLGLLHTIVFKTVLNAPPPPSYSMCCY